MDAILPTTRTKGKEDSGVCELYRADLRQGETAGITPWTIPVAGTNWPYIMGAVVLSDDQIWWSKVVARDVDATESSDDGE
jgi:hypothetical protein